MKSKIPEINAEQLPEGYLHKRLEVNPETHGSMLQQIFNSNISVHPENRCENSFSRVYFLVENAVAVSEIEAGVRPHSIKELPVSSPVHTHFNVFLPEKGKYSSVLPVAHLSFIRSCLLQIYPEGDAA